MSDPTDADKATARDIVEDFADRLGMWQGYPLIDTIARALADAREQGVRAGMLAEIATAREQGRREGAEEMRAAILAADRWSGVGVEAIRAVTIPAVKP